jgi:hypothetical protein
MPTSIRPAFRTLRLFGLLLAIAGAVLAVLLVINDAWIPAAWVLGLGVLFAVLTWVLPTSRWHFPLLALLGTAIVLTFRSWIAFAALVALLIWLAWARRLTGPLPTDIEFVEKDAVMQNASEFIEAFESLGFEQVGAYRASIGRVQIVVSLLLSSDAKSYATVTDAVLEVTSLFSNGHTMVTRNSNLSSLPPEVLVNPHRGAQPVELYASHQRALHTLEDHGHSPAELSPADVPEIAMNSELVTIDWMSGKKRYPRPEYQAQLSVLSDRSERIAAWQSYQR